MLITTDEQKEYVKGKIKEDKIERTEKVLNYLIGKILSESENRYKYIRKFTDKSVEFEDGMDIWYEAKPLPPRKHEGNTQLDLAFGNIKNRGNTKSGIEYNQNMKGSWVCFVEGKLYADCSTQVKYDPLRNQLERIIENLLCFQKNGNFPKKLYFTLLTPRLFKNNDEAKLYGYKMKEYQDRNNILNDIKSARNKKVNMSKWKYPEIEERIENLSLKWITYEEIIGEEYDLIDCDVTEIDDRVKNVIINEINDWI